MKSKKVPQESKRLRRQEECSAQEQSVFSFQPRQGKYQDRITEFYGKWKFLKRKIHPCIFLFNENFQEKLGQNRKFSLCFSATSVWQELVANKKKTSVYFSFSREFSAKTWAKQKILSSLFCRILAASTIQDSQITIRNF